jgi:hypothetical protein
MSGDHNMHCIANQIKTWVQRCEEHPAHQSGMVSHSMIQQRMQEEIDDLRAALVQQEQEKPMNECNHEYELDFRSSIHICKHCGTMRSNRPTQKPAGWLYDLQIDGQVVKDWFTRDESEAKKHANVRPLYFGRNHD